MSRGGPDGTTNPLREPKSARELFTGRITSRYGRNLDEITAKPIGKPTGHIERKYEAEADYLIQALLYRPKQSTNSYKRLLTRQDTHHNAVNNTETS